MAYPVDTGAGWTKLGAGVIEGLKVAVDNVW